MTLLELLSSSLAPHLCLVCREEGPPLCTKCARSGLLTPGYAERPPPIGNLWIAAKYSGFAKELVAQLKFQRVKAASSVIAWWMDECLPALPPDALISAIPTADKRVRMRGYDQARLIARAFARRRGLEYADTLYRMSATRQVGSRRADRLLQMAGAFRARRPSLIAGRHIILIDDVFTTGATIEQAASALGKHGARRLDAAVFAH